MAVKNTDCSKEPSIPGRSRHDVTRRACYVGYKIVLQINPRMHSAVSLRPMNTDPARYIAPKRLYRKQRKQRCRVTTPSNYNTNRYSFVTASTQQTTRISIFKLLIRGLDAAGPLEWFYIIRHVAARAYRAWS